VIMRPRIETSLRWRLTLDIVRLTKRGPTRKQGLPHSEDAQAPVRPTMARQPSPRNIGGRGTVVSENGSSYVGRAVIVHADHTPHALSLFLVSRRLQGLRTPLVGSLRDAG
jgi:hypothetical protein